MFVYFQNDIVMYLLVCMDDIMLIGNTITTLSSFVQALSQQFFLKDLRDPHYLLSVEVLPSKDGILLFQ